MPKTKSKSKKSKKSKSSKTSKTSNDVIKQKVEQLDSIETVTNVVAEKVEDKIEDKVEDEVEDKVEDKVEDEVEDEVNDLNDTSDTEDIKNVDTIVEKTLVSRIDSHITTLQKIKKLISTELKHVQELRKVAKQETKKKKRKKSSSGKPNNSGIMRKFKIPKKLQKFMGTDIASRVDALKFISAYARENDLQDENDKRFIEIDDNLALIFPVLIGKTGKERLCFTSIMTHISSYFPKKGTEDYDKMVVIEDNITIPETE